MNNKKKILIVEEDKLFNNILTKYFEQKDFDVTSSNIGHRYIRQAVEAKPDVIIVDTDMPSQVGYDFTREISNNSSIKGTPLIVISAAGQDSSREKGISMGADFYMTKPLNLEELSNKVENYLH